MQVDLTGLNLIVGLGQTGYSIARYLSSRGYRCRVIDSRRSPPELAALRAAIDGVEVHCGSLDATALEGVDRVFASPGLHSGLPIFAAARAAELPLHNDIDLFARVAEAPVIAITGSNGKSTVTDLVATLLRAQGLSALAGGNLGPPALDLLDRPTPDAYVLEISSFQMEFCESLEPTVGAVLNVSPDHLDRHDSFATYAGLKEKLLRKAAHAIVNWDDPVVREMGRQHSHSVKLSLVDDLASGYCIVTRGDRQYLARDRKPLVDAAELTLRGRHNWLNALAALAILDSFGRDSAASLDALTGYAGLPHRCEFVLNRHGVDYVNDSKATNVGAAIAALQGLRGPFVLIAGGDAKGADFGALAETARGKVKAAVVLGADAARLATALADVCSVQRVDSLDSAVIEATRIAAAGDCVLLSPACSSLDMFTDYRARGRDFIDAVRRLPP